MCSAAAAFPAAVAEGTDRRPPGLPARLPVWRADRVDNSATARAGEDRGAAATQHPTGYDALDAELPGGGWPAAGLTELLLPALGGGEVRLLAPALASASMLWVAPPFTPYAPALEALGFALDRLVIVAASVDNSVADAAWAAEQALRSGTLGAVLWWEAQDSKKADKKNCSNALPPTTLRRLHLAALEGHTPLFAMRPIAARMQSSPAPLRLTLEPAAASSKYAVDVFKRRGPPMGAPLLLALPTPTPVRSGRAPPLSPRQPEAEDPHAVVRPAPERIAA